MNKIINLNNIIEIRKIGLQALNDALGPVGMVKFIQLFENGSGDYTNEKYQQPDISIDELTSLFLTTD